ncbi:MAG: hypothetical protein K2X94_00555 [Amoebophilaceae bacterium]|nr:hypothetical protein [Amoebophilaceae bacterium]
MKNKKGQIKSIRFSEYEIHVLVNNAKKMNINVSKLIRFYCGFEKISINKVELNDARFYLGKITNNINQIGKALKSAHTTFRIDVSLFELHLKNIMVVSSTFKNITNDIFNFYDLQEKIELKVIIENLQQLSSNVNQIAKELNVANLTTLIEPARYSNSMTRLYLVKTILTKLEIELLNILTKLEIDHDN